jgi:hypothetical protein
MEMRRLVFALIVLASLGLAALEVIASRDVADAPPTLRLLFK